MKPIKRKKEKQSVTLSNRSYGVNLKLFKTLKKSLLLNNYPLKQQKS